jgi:hypothetical protein
MMRSIAKFYHLGQGKKAGRFIGQQDVRCYLPPLGYSAIAELTDCHPFTQQHFAQSEWWIFLTPNDDYEQS